jgi:hypothetical protein
VNSANSSYEISLEQPNFGSDNTLEESQIILENSNLELSCSSESQSSEEDDLLFRLNKFSVSENVEETQITKQVQLRAWTLKHSITHSALSDLLKMLHKWIPNDHFPIDSRTLMKTPKSIELQDISGGKYYYFGLKNKIQKLVKLGIQPFKLPNISNLNSVENLLTLTIGIDGLPISKSSNLQFWPILGKLDQCIDPSPFVIALFYGETKPSSVLDFLNPLINEMILLETQGLTINNINYSFRIRCIISDAPARSYIKCIKPHQAYHGCERCYCKFEWDRKVIYRDGIYKPYSNETFRNHKYKKHHDGQSPLLRLDLDMVYQIPLDYMHMCCLGVMKRLLLVWSNGKHKLSRNQLTLISERLISFKKFIPSNFARKP